MKDDKHYIEIMKYLEGDTSNTDIKEEAQELKELVQQLKSVPYENVNAKTDDRINDIIKRNTKSKSTIKLRTWLPYTIAAASLVILISIFVIDKPNVQENYKLLHSNPDKLSFIYNLNTTELDTEKVRWLQNELKIEKNPNIKVAIIDLLNNHTSKLNRDFLETLTNEQIPTVQMAILNTIQTSDQFSFKKYLTSFSERNTIDNTVRGKINEMLKN